MSQNPNELHCEQDNLINSYKELQNNNQAKNDCNRPKSVPAAGLGKFSQCCKLSAISPIPSKACIQQTEKVRTVNDDYCEGTCKRPSCTSTNVKLKDQNCACVKFNGLQDTCRHPLCSTKRGCLDVPFPSCPPARKWKANFGKPIYGSKNKENC
ncbi:uncharacterized protein LOC126904695 [Daktulosphaira vitifoliae]|uniref:uncharacterized protein LOC126904695 n=1 Tax=Daktulosphaira vitifoliae TaxID=58002 RepID=UPI0021AABF0E|nr:uncharacterized protein LOC126904695 [Daktulosphaira vitifoliae]